MYSCLLRSVSGTSLLTIIWARPSTIAVLPTPGSPISTGLFLVRRDRICMTRSSSRVRPMTGSSLRSRASWVKLRPNWSRIWLLPLSLAGSSLVEPPTLAPAVEPVPPSVRPAGPW